MKWEEEVVSNFLIQQGYKPEYEPDGNTPPDFSIENGNIGIEVRRLNKHLFIDDQPKPLEEDYFKVIPAITAIFTSISHTKSSNSYFVIIRFGRPIKLNKSIKKDINNFFLDVRENGYSNPYSRNNLYIQLMETSRKEIPFLTGVTDDDDSGGFVIKDICDNLIHVIQEKSEKILPYKSKYSIWWLILINNVSGNLDKYETGRLLAQNIRLGEFNKVIIIAAYEPFNPIEIN